jgi:pyruvate formate lyase activating enzyme
MPGLVITRREFLVRSARLGGVVAGAGALLSQPAWWRWPGSGNRGGARAAESLSELARNAPRARYWISEKSAGARCSTCHGANVPGNRNDYEHDSTPIKCRLCAMGCVLSDGERGRCRARINVGGTLRSLVYGRPITVHVDPIEKKPFYHFLPGSRAFSLATSGCPLRCSFCQNWEISQARPEDYRSPVIGPSRIAEQARHQRAPVIAYTYNEPTVFTEYLIDIARAARERGIRSVLVSCGFMTEAPLREMCGVLDAIKIDLKGFSPDFYRKVCGVELKPVLRSIRQIARSKVHLEIVNLVVPTLNDSDTMLKGLAHWVVNEVGPDVPVHFTRFHPDYKMRNLPPTPTATLERARAIAMDRGIRYVFVGNLPGHPGNHTYCPKCRKVLIERRGFLVERSHVKNGRCGYCGEKIAGVWS